MLSVTVKYKCPGWPWIGRSSHRPLSLHYALQIGTLVVDALGRIPSLRIAHSFSPKETPRTCCPLRPTPRRISIVHPDIPSTSPQPLASHTACPPRPHHIRSSNTLVHMTLLTNPHTSLRTHNHTNHPQRTDDSDITTSRARMLLGSNQNHEGNHEL